MPFFKKIAKAATKKVFKPAAKKALKAVGGKPTPSLRSVIRAAKTYNPVTGPLGAIKKVTKALQPKPQPRRRGRR